MMFMGFLYNAMFPHDGVGILPMIGIEEAEQH